MTTLIVAPTAREARAIGASVIACGAGERARESAARLLDEVRPAAVVLLGVCGGLDPSLMPGDLVLARRVLASDGRELAPEIALVDGVRAALRRRGFSFVTAPLLTVDRPLAGRRPKAEVWNATGAAGVDMESYSVAEAACERSVPWIALRGVLDASEASLPTAIRNWTGEGDERRALANAAARPWEWPAYLRLALAWRSALRSLREAMPVVTAAVEEWLRSAPAAVSTPSLRR
ncbi:MAG TPA: hypothetical protein VNN07_15195 [Candidatus Tectomicrobia bacterium]|nr:hypothetical protein [Candidatus Tectomicrobia bacterium]